MLVKRNNTRAASLTHAPLIVQLFRLNGRGSPVLEEALDFGFVVALAFFEEAGVLDVEDLPLASRTTKTG